MRNEILYVGEFKLPDRDAGAVRVSGVADALAAVGYAVKLIGNDYQGPAGTDRTLPLSQHLSIVVRRGLDLMVTSSSYFRQLESVDWQRVAAVICYPGSTALIWRLMHTCREHDIPFIIDSVEWYEPSHTMGGRFGLIALDSEFRMRWLHQRSRNIICISSLLAQYYSSKGCNVIKVPPLIGKNGNGYSADLTVSRLEPMGQLNLVYAGYPSRKELFAEIIAGVQASRRRGVDVYLRLVGITEEQLSTIIEQSGERLTNLDGIICYGRLAREAALQIVTASDFTVLLRPQKRFANAGFPSKFVESLSLGVPVITNATSDIAEYLRDGQEGYLVCDATAGALEEAVVCASKLTIEQRGRMRIQAHKRAHECFSYKEFARSLAQFISRARPCS
jgi:glycosyltransferase involved in cell wall biosynthesis